MKNANTSALGLLLLAGCVTTKSPSSTVAAVTECSAGSSSSVSATLNAKIADNISDGLEFDAGIKDQIRGEFMNNIAGRVSEENAVKLYDSYVGCLKMVRAPAS